MFKILFLIFCFSTLSVRTASNFNFKCNLGYKEDYKDEYCTINYFCPNGESLNKIQFSMIFKFNMVNGQMKYAPGQIVSIIDNCEKFSRKLFIQLLYENKNYFLIISNELNYNFENFIKININDIISNKVFFNIGFSNDDLYLDIDNINADKKGFFKRDINYDSTYHLKKIILIFGRNNFCPQSHGIIEVSKSDYDIADITNSNSTDDYPGDRLKNETIKKDQENTDLREKEINKVKNELAESNYNKRVFMCLFIVSLFVSVSYIMNKKFKILQILKRAITLPVSTIDNVQALEENNELNPQVLPENDIQDIHTLLAEENK